MNNEDRELQIELIDLQIDHEYLTSAFMGNLAMQFGAIVGLVATFYSLYDRPIHFLIPTALIVAIFGISFTVYFTLWSYGNKRKRIKNRIEELRKKHIW